MNKSEVYCPIQRKIEAQIKNTKKQYLRLYILMKTAVKNEVKAAECIKYVFCEYIPKSTLLTIPDCKINRLRVFISEKEWTILENMTKLSVNLSHASLGIRSGQLLSKFMPRVSKLTYVNLNLSKNHLQDEGVAYISLGLPMLCHLRTLILNLSENGITGKGFNLVGRQITKLQTLDTIQLNFNKNNINDEIELNIFGIENHAQKFSNLKKLFLELQENAIRNQGLVSLAKGISDAENLEFLQGDLRYNEIGDEGVAALGQSLGKLKKLKKVELDFFRNQINSEGLTMFSQSLEDQKCQLETLSLDCCKNQIELQGFQNLAGSLGRIRTLNLITLDLTFNSESLSAKTDRDLIKMIQSANAQTVNIYV